MDPVPVGKLWVCSGSQSDSPKEITRYDENLKERSTPVGKQFRVLPFVCGEIHDWGTDFFDPKTDTGDADVVLVASHASVNRTWSRTKRPWPRCAFQRMFFDLRTKCGALLAHAHEEGDDYARRQDDWVVFRRGYPFPGEDVAVVPIR